MRENINNGIDIIIITNRIAADKITYKTCLRCLLSLTKNDPMPIARAMAISVSGTIELNGETPIAAVADFMNAL